MGPADAGGGAAADHLQKVKGKKEKGKSESSVKISEMAEWTGFFCVMTRMALTIASPASP